ncbi:hypothetical protein HP10700_08075 [Helicobacter pylori 10700]|nr:hypothetical protein HP10700_08075 [Helicobacter pylori 10700]KAF0998577.1 hypothetical protein HPYSS1_05671 [Helicobacter pylori SS1]KAF0998894.1 hypothetical protein HPSS1190_03704 [Helicobacter pylori SS1_190]
MLFQSKEVSKKPFFLKTPLKNNRFNENRKKAHLVRQFHSLMVFESVFLNLKRLLQNKRPIRAIMGINSKKEFAMEN